MMKERCENISDVISNIQQIIARQEDLNPNDSGAEYFFRGESKCHYDDGEFGTAFQSSLDRKGLVEYEREIYNDAIRRNIADFTLDSSMAERIARMQHYQLPTRFADISENALCALYFACSAGYGTGKDDGNDEDGYIRVIKVASHKMKQFNSDIIIAISHLPLVKPEQVNLLAGADGVDYLRYEVTNSRPGFWNADESVKQRLIDELQQVWAFRPICNNRRIISQGGLFLAFGCGDKKTSLKPSFSPEDYDDKEAPSNGIMQIGYVRIAGASKKGIVKELRYYGMTEEIVYPELANANGALTKKYETLKLEHSNEL